jgi:hypothetical protein
MATKPLSDLTATWNASGTTFTAVKMNVTDTASAAGSALIDLQVGGVSQFKVSKAGVPTFISGATNAQTQAGVLSTVPVTPLNLANRAMFSVHKGGTDQTGIVSNTPTLITWSTEANDVGGYFASSKWTPPAGGVRLNASLFISAGLTVSTLTILYIYKNGAAWKQFLTYGAISESNGVSVTANDVANGTDYYEVYLYMPSATTGTVSGNALYSYFMGEQI